MIENLKQLKAFADAAESDPGTDERMDTHEHFEFVYALDKAWPKLLAVVEAGEKLRSGVMLNKGNEAGTYIHYAEITKAAEEWDKARAELGKTAR